jgi:hypothetical protein
LSHTMNSKEPHMVNTRIRMFWVNVSMIDLSL